MEENINIKELEEKHNELNNKIKQYYEDEERKRIQQNEEKYVGKCYKLENNGSTTYMKILSGLTNNTYCYMHCMKFKLPIEPRFKNNFRMNDYRKFHYEFTDDVLEFDDILIKEIPYDKGMTKRIEITVDEFENALNEFGKQLIKLSRKDFTMNGIFFRD